MDENDYNGYCNFLTIWQQGKKMQPPLTAKKLGMLLEPYYPADCLNPADPESGHKKKQYRRKCEMFTIGEIDGVGTPGILYYRPAGWSAERLPRVVKKAELADVLAEIHSSDICSALCDAKVPAEIVKGIGYYWPDMVEDLANATGKCAKCCALKEEARSFKKYRNFSRCSLLFIEMNDFDASVDRKLGLFVQDRVTCDIIYIACKACLVRVEEFISKMLIQDVVAVHGPMIIEASNHVGMFLLFVFVYFRFRICKTS